MNALVKPLLRPLPLLGLSTGGIILATTLSRTSTMSSSTSTKKPWPVTPYTPRHTSWPYNPSDFTRQDSSPDAGFYSAPRFVTHIDDAAIETLAEYYDDVLPRKGRILDFCSSWISHYPRAIDAAAKSGELDVVGMGMNKAELVANPFFEPKDPIGKENYFLVDLNTTPDGIATSIINPSEPEKLLDASTCVVSIDYLTNPVSVLQSLLSATKPGGTVHLAISNRCFPTKAISRWLRVREDERLQMVGDFLHFAGWKRIEVVELSNGKVDEEPAEQGTLKGLMGFMGMGGRDPLWVVRAAKE